MKKTTTTARLIIGSKPAEDYALQAIMEFHRGSEVVELYGVSDNICKVVDVYLLIRDRLGEALEYLGGEIGSVRGKGRRRNYLLLRIKYKV